MQLSARLQQIASFVRPGDRVIDVGTDHAYIPIWLLKNGLVRSAIATDIRSGPLERASADARRFGVADTLTLRLTDGLLGCAAEEADTVIIAGMGGETMIGILSAAPWAKDKRLILQPQTKQDQLRRWLGEHGLAITDAALVHDTGRIYLVWLVEAGEMAPFRGVDAALLTRRDPLLKPYLEEQIKRARKQLHGLGQSATADPAQLSALQGQLENLETIYHEVQQWQV